MPKKIQRKAFAFDLKSANEDGTFVGIASVYGNTDLQGDVVDKGAFAKSLTERGNEVPILWQHDPRTPIGLGTLTDTPKGLQIAGKLSLGTEKGRDAYELLKDGVIKGLSIGYDVVKQKFQNGARHLQELALFEVSAVTFPANEEALVGSVKHAGAKGMDESEAAELIQYQAVAAVIDQAEASLEQMRLHVDALVAAENEQPADPDAEVEEEELERARMSAICGAAGQVVSAMYAVQSTAYAFLREHEDDDDACTGYGYMGHAVDETKAGRAISAANHEKLKAAHGYMQKAMKHVKDVMSRAKPATAVEPDDSATGSAGASKGVSPSDISTKKADESETWSKPTLGDFTDKSWDKLSDDDKKDIAEHFAWSDKAIPSSFGDLKLGHHDPKTGAVVWKGVVAAIGRLNQADIPDADLPKVKAHLRRHYKAFRPKDELPDILKEKDADLDLETKDDEIAEALRKNIAAMRPPAA